MNTRFLMIFLYQRHIFSKITQCAILFLQTWTQIHGVVHLYHCLNLRYLPTKTQIFAHYEIGIHIQNVKKYVKKIYNTTVTSSHIRNDPTVASS